MDELPYEIQRVILGHLNLNDLARCGRVSRDLGDRVNEVLSTITSIYHKMDCSDEIEDLSQHLSLALRTRAAESISSEASFTDENLRSFLQFIDKKCSRLSTLIATRYRVHLEDISGLANGISILMVGNIITGGHDHYKHTIDAETLAASFPNLQFYHLSYGRDLCPNEVTRAYSLSQSTQLVKYRESCSKRHTCRPTVDVRSIDHLFSICVESPLVFSELRPSSLNSLQFLDLKSPPSENEPLPHLPNLLRATLHCEENLNNMIYLLYNSPKLSAVFFTGEINELSIPALNLLLSNSTDLQAFHLTCYTEDYNIVNNPDHCLNLRSKSLKKVSIKKRWADAGISHMAMRVALPPDCDRIECHPYTIHFNMNGRTYTFEDDVVSFRGMRAFAHPVELEIHRGIERYSAARVLPLCPRISGLTYHFGYSDVARELLPTFQRILARSDVSDIRLIYFCNAVSDSLAHAFFGEISKYQDRLFSVTIRGIESGHKVRWILGANVFNNCTISYGDYQGRLEVHVKIPPTGGAQ